MLISKRLLIFIIVAIISILALFISKELSALQITKKLSEQSSEIPVAGAQCRLPLFALLGTPQLVSWRWTTLGLTHL